MYPIMRNSFVEQADTGLSAKILLLLLVVMASGKSHPQNVSADDMAIADISMKAMKGPRPEMSLFLNGATLEEVKNITNFSFGETPNGTIFAERERERERERAYRPYI